MAGEMTAREYRPCGVCGTPTISASGFCKRTTACRNARDRLRVRGQRKPEPARCRCSVCGKPTANSLGVCALTPECKQEHNRLFWRSVNPEPPPCEVCGEPTGSILGVCQDSVACRQEHSRRTVAAKPEAVRRREADRARTWRAENPEESQARAVRYRAEHLEDVRAKGRAYQREYMQRLGRPCRGARVSGCTASAERWSHYCAVHKKAARALRRARQIRRLAQRQGGMCMWCAQPLPAGLCGVHVDHIIPVSANGPDLEWNLQVLHGPCNREKWDRITPQALALAAEHGITLAAA